MVRDVIVIGGGPAGLRFAYTVACGGYDAVVFDDRSQIGERKICTGIVSHEAFERFQLWRDCILNDITNVKFISPEGSELHYAHPSVLAHAVNRTAFDQRLADMAEAQGVEIRLGARVERVILHKDHVQVETATGVNSHQHEALKARVVVIATGVNFRLNRSVGLGVPDEFLNAAQAHVHVSNLDSAVCYIGRHTAPGAFAWMVPLDNKRARVGLMVGENPAPYFQRLLQRINDHRTDKVAPIDVDYKPIVQRFAGPTYGHRVIAIGEAAGQVKTTTGGGIYYAMLCAELAAGVVMDALKRNRCDETFMSRYEKSWKKLISQELRLGYLFRKAFANLSDHQVEKLFAFAQINGVIPLIKKTARFDWHAEVLCSLASYGTIRKTLGITLNKLCK